MAVTQLKDGRYIVQHRDSAKPSGYSRKYFGRGPNAFQAASQYDDSLKHRPYIRNMIRTESPLFIDLVNAYLRSKASAGVSPKNLKATMYRLNSTIVPMFGHLQISRISHEMLDEYVKRRRKTVKGSTVRRDIEIISAILTFAVKRNFLKYSPMTGYLKPAPDDEVISPPTADEIRGILQHARPHLKRAIITAYYLGLRFGGELFNLKWSAFNLDRRIVIVESAKKGGSKTRTIPLADEYAAYLYAWRRADGNKDGYLITYAGRKLTTVKKAFSSAKKAAGITRRIRPYDMRHVFATFLLNSGQDLKSVSEMLGHSTPSITMRVYQHTSSAIKRDIVNKLPPIEKTNVTHLPPGGQTKLRIIK